MKLLHVMVKIETYAIVLQSDGVTHRKSDSRWNSSVNIGRLETKPKKLSVRCSKAKPYVLISGHTNEFSCITNSLLPARIDY